jgi:epoxyqueuosine reductase
MSQAADALKAQARSLGFDLVGIAPAVEADGFASFRAWLDAGYAGEMDYLHRHAQARQHPAAVLPEVRSVVMLGAYYAN